MHVGKLSPTPYFLIALLAGGLVFLTGVVFAGSGETATPANPIVVRIYYNEIGDLNRLAGYDLFEYNNLEARFVHAALTWQEVSELRGAGWLVVEEQPAWWDFAPHVYFGGYRTVDELYLDMGQLTSQWPVLAELVPYGQSYCKIQNGCTTPGGEQTSGHELLAVRVTNEEIPGGSIVSEGFLERGQKPVLFMLANIHGRELTTPEIAMRWLALLLEEYGTDPDITWLVDWHEMWIIPTANPDGHWVTELGTANGYPLMHRKNFDRDADGDGLDDCEVWPSLSYSQLGVDLNRNHSFAWRPPSSTTSACELTYSGPGPASEPEVAALQGLIETLFADRRGPGPGDVADEDTAGLLFTLHNYGEMILRPWAHTGDPPPDEPSLKAIGDKLGSLTGYRSCRSPECLYFSHGTTDDWAYGDLGLPSFTFEIGTSAQGFSPPYQVIDEEQWPENRAAFLYAARIARSPYQLVHGPVVTDLAVVTDPDGIPTVKVVIDDQDHGQQPVASAEYSLGNPFWIPQAQPEPLIHVDGLIGIQSEFTAKLDTAALPPGRHTIFVRGTDIEGHTGPTSAAFFYIPDPGQNMPETRFIPFAVGQ